MFKAITAGFDRGLFATDAGLGIVPILQASAKSEHPIVDGIASLIAPLVVMITCSATGIVLIITGAYQDPLLQSTNMVTHAFSEGLSIESGGSVEVIDVRGSRVVVRPGTPPTRDADMLDHSLDLPSTFDFDYPADDDRA